MIPMIRQVQIQNYKSIARLAVNLEPFTVFVGPNGSGKSNFIDALSFVNDCLLESIEIAFSKRSAQEIVHRSSAGYESLLGIRLVLGLSENLSADYAFAVVHRRGERSGVLRERCVVQNSMGKKHEFDVRDGQFVKETTGIRPRLSPDRLALDAASATDEYRPVYEFLTSMGFYSIVPERLREWQQPEPGDFLKRDGSNAAAVLKCISDQRDYERLCHLLSISVKGVEKVDYRSTPIGETIVFEHDVGASSHEKLRLDASSMSDGTLRLLALLLAVYQPRRPSVVAIEEPEATVHPAITELVVEVLMDAAYKRQILVTTHSPDILDQKELSDKQIRAVTWEEGETLICPVSKASRDAIRERLYTPGELLRVDELSPDIDAAKNITEQVDLFGAPMLGETEQR